MTTQVRAERLQSVVRYYDGTWLDYRFLWLNSDNLAIHFGFDDGNTRSHSEALINTNRALADLADIQPGDRVLDAGCGIAGSSVWLARERGANVIGITPVRSQVERARAAAQQHGLADQLSFEVADYAATAFQDASFDVIWALESVCHAESKQAVYAEFGRLLRPGGRLIIAEYIRSSRRLPQRDEALLHEWLDGWMIPDIDTREEHIAHAQRAGLAAVKVRDVTPNMRKSLRRLYALTLPGVPIGQVLNRFGLRSDVLQGNVVGSNRQYRALRRGIWFYGFITATKPA